MAHCPRQSLPAAGPGSGVQAEARARRGLRQLTKLQVWVYLLSTHFEQCANPVHSFQGTTVRRQTGRTPQHLRPTSATWPPPSLRTPEEKKEQNKGL